MHLMPYALRVYFVKNPLSYSTKNGTFQYTFTLISILIMEQSSDVKNILGLQLPTDPRWADIAGISLEAILTDHAYCEQKAATSCISLIQRYSEREKLVKELAPIVTEEWGHFRMVLNELQKRGWKLGKQRKDAYVNKLLEFQQRGGRVVDRPFAEIPIGYLHRHLFVACAVSSLFSAVRSAPF